MFKKVIGFMRLHIIPDLFDSSPHQMRCYKDWLINYIYVQTIEDVKIVLMKFVSAAISMYNIYNSLELSLTLGTKFNKLKIVLRKQICTIFFFKYNNKLKNKIVI